MSDARDPLVCRAIYIRSFMERSRGDIKQWSWVWEKEIQNIEVSEEIIRRSNLGSFCPTKYKYLSK